MVSPGPVHGDQLVQCRNQKSFVIKKKYRYGIVKRNIAIFQCIDIYRFSYLPDLGAMLTWLTSCRPGGRAVAHIPQLWVIGPRGAVLMTTPGRGRRLFTALIRKGQAAAVGARPRAREHVVSETPSLDDALART